MASRADIAERSFERLTETKGDITHDVLSRYYARFPEAQQSFQHHGLNDVPELEGRMVTATAFMLLQWAQEPQTVKIEQGTTITHHHDTLLIGPQWYLGLVDAVLEVLLETLPAEATDEHAMWREVRAEVAAFIDSVRPEFWRSDNDGPLPPGPFPSEG